MDREHAVAVLRKVIAYCPAQKLNDDSRNAWAEALAGTDFADALDAVAIIGSRPLEPGDQLWIQPGHVIAEVKRIRRARLSSFDRATVTGAPTDPSEFLDWTRRVNEQVASGHADQLPQIEPGDDKHQVSADFIHELRARAKREQAHRTDNPEEN